MVGIILVHLYIVVLFLAVPVAELLEVLLITVVLLLTLMLMLVTLYIGVVGVQEVRPAKEMMVEVLGKKLNHYLQRIGEVGVPEVAEVLAELDKMVDQALHPRRTEAMELQVI